MSRARVSGSPPRPAPAHRLACLALLLLSLAPGRAWAEAPGAGEPPTPEPALTALEVVSGLPAQAVAIAALSIGYSSLRLPSSVGAEALATVMFVILAPSVSSLVVWSVASLSGRYRPSLGYTLLGGAAGATAGLLTLFGLWSALLAQGIGKPTPGQAVLIGATLVTLVVVPPVVGEVIACNLTKERLPAARRSAWMPRLGVPLPEVAWSPGRPAQVRLGLLRGSF